MRLKEWLIAQIDSGRYTGLNWENQEKTMFRIPWKHAAKQDYRQNEDAALFKVRDEILSLWSVRFICIKGNNQAYPNGYLEGFVSLYQGLYLIIRLYLIFVHQLEVVLLRKINVFQSQSHKLNNDLLLQAWAIYKGKYREGRDKADPSVWKTRLRCALNKSTEFQEVPERSQLDISEPYKVYRILQDTNQPAGNKQLSNIICILHFMITVNVM